jgi:hypothetical protein
MDKTLLKKLTEKQSFSYNSSSFSQESGDAFATFRQEKRIVEALSNDLLQPRPEAIANILEMARKM